LFLWHDSILVSKVWSLCGYQGESHLTTYLSDPILVRHWLI
jgi:hypothetical protein